MTLETRYDFFQLFQLNPTLVFELLPDPPNNAQGYRFDSVAVKEAKFEIDGVFLPPTAPGEVIFAEVQFQKDDTLYERLVAESALYFYRNRSQFSNYRLIVIYPNRSTEQDDTLPHQHWFDSHKLTRVFLNELGDCQQLPLGVALMVLTTLSEQEAPQAARGLLQRSQEAQPPMERRAMMELINTVMVYKFTNLSREEIETMLGTTLQETRVYQEARDEGRQEGQLALVLEQLTDLVGQLPPEITAQVQALPLEQLHSLGKALLRFSQLSDLQTWLQNMPFEFKVQN